MAVSHAPAGLDPEQLGVENADGLLEQFLAGLVALEDDDLQGVRHGRVRISSRNGADARADGPRR